MTEADPRIDARAFVGRANLECHALESDVYDVVHPEAKNFYQHRAMNEQLDQIAAALGPSRRRALDTGCGTGFLALQLLARGFTVTAVDFSPEMLEVFRRKVAGQLAGRVVIHQAEANEFLDECEEQFDLVGISAFLHHLYEVEPLLARAAARVAEGGVLYINHEPLRQPSESWWQFAVDRTVAAVDEGIFRLEMLTRRIRLSDFDYEDADYQRRFGGIDPAAIEETLRLRDFDPIQVIRYAVRRYGIAAWFENELFDVPNTFAVIARRKRKAG